MRATVGWVGLHVVVSCFLTAPNLRGSIAEKPTSPGGMGPGTTAARETGTAQTPEYDQAIQAGAAALQARDFESALRATTAYQRAHELRPESVEACLGLGRSYRRLFLDEEILTLVDECQAGAAPHPNLELMRGRTLLRMGMGSAARAALEAATMAGSVEARFDLALLVRDEGDLDIAVEQLQALIRVRPRRALAHVRLAELYIHRGEISAAEELLQRVLSMEACCAAQAHDLLGSIRYKASDLEGAITHAREAIKLDPELKLAHYNLALALRASGQREEAERAMQRFQEMTSTEEQRQLEQNQATQIGLRNAQGLYYFRRERPAEALEIFEAALELAPDDALIHYNIGLSRAALGQHEGAITALERARELQPQRAEIYDVLAAAYRALGRVEDAERIEELRQQLEGQR